MRSKLTIKKQNDVIDGQCLANNASVFIVNFEHISRFF